MYLLLDLSIKDVIHLALFDKQVIEHKKYSGMNRELLSCIDDFIRVCKVNKVHKVFKVEDLGGIMVVVGSGSFTSTRIACVVANTFAYVLQIPLLAIGEDKIDKVQELIPELLKQPRGQYISATYSGEANIGNNKK
ncbi:hypothetical protein KJ785_03120 [Patescibacteria group bacterium]|nr:hypothetical protein [Patescibacteria group bacterium]